MFETVLTNVEVEKRSDGIAIITLNRTDAANALSKQMLRDLKTAANDLKNNPEVRVIILTGAGEKAFCAGADLKERKTMTEIEVKQAVRSIGETVNEVASLPQPVIAALNGVAFGGGLELALACDLRIGALETKVGLTETSLGIIPGAGGTQRLPRLIGLGKAKELIFSAKRLTAEEAEVLGILEYVVPREQLLDKALEIAVSIAKNAPLALVQAKAAINNGIEVDLSTGLKIEELAYNELLPTEDRLEGLRAFAEKRAPQYTGK
ncbi:enoyl-CoA hydratase [Psychrobacillus sp. OK032]|uniref:enoyl-CoA hydratase n=1 Tax=Psychrobacillus sp. OK032 TaxID=1884358 RepID=UPI0008D1FD4D|nr:enoyl-CoA hydratase [Psychrobacillus sp. OK032]SES42180.1 Enoyl-CoA hydratase/carnithine racemase [Psychrobacillus sp. OK032]